MTTFTIHDLVAEISDEFDIDTQRAYAIVEGLTFPADMEEFLMERRNSPSPGKKRRRTHV